MLSSLIHLIKIILIIEFIYYKDFLTVDWGRLMHFQDFFGISRDMMTDIDYLCI